MNNLQIEEWKRLFPNILPLSISDESAEKYLKIQRQLVENIGKTFVIILREFIPYDSLSLDNLLVPPPREGNTSETIKLGTVINPMRSDENDPQRMVIPSYVHVVSSPISGVFFSKKNVIFSESEMLISESFEEKDEDIYPDYHRALPIGRFRSDSSCRMVIYFGEEAKQWFRQTGQIMLYNQMSGILSYYAP